MGDMTGWRRKRHVDIIDEWWGGEGVTEGVIVEVARE